MLKVKKRIAQLMSVLLWAGMLSGFTGVTAFAAVAELDSDSGHIEIFSSHYSINGLGTTAHPDTDGYIITGSSNTTDSHISVTSGTHQITLENVSLQTNTCAFEIASGAEVTLILDGTNSVTSSAGYAGIYVEEGASLTIEGTGSLNVTGGSSSTAGIGGGAGIGGNGLNDGTNSFGAITIDSGTITAIGGNTTASNLGAGAGIGSGGAYDKETSGSIVINGGTVEATGGDSDPNSGFSGAGIGAGGNVGYEVVSGNSYTYPQTPDITVEITGGNVNATGGIYAAGIGGCNEGHSGPITITGGTVIPRGTGESGENYGGAGIGGGDMGSASTINISGNANVYARGGGAAAAIGGGYDGGVAIFDADIDIYEPVANGEINIFGNAVVRAFGGTGSGGDTPGGAGIGNGANRYSDVFSGIITIEGYSKVSAGGGAGAAGIGGGYNRSTFYTSSNVNRYSNYVQTITIGGNAAVAGDSVFHANGGGAGIGSGYRGDAGQINIGEDANVTALGVNGGAGIGSGFGGAIWKYELNEAGETIDEAGKINVGGSAVVAAFGGDGGAGIGAGQAILYYYSGLGEWLNNSGNIKITNEAFVTAYGGAGAQAVGAGEGYYDTYAAYVVSGEDSLFIDETIKLHMFNVDDIQPAYNASTVSGTGKPYLVAFTNDATFPSTGSSQDTTTADTYTWDYEGVSTAYSLNIYEDNSGMSIYDALSNNTAFGNWGILLKTSASTPTYHTVTFITNGGSPVPSTQTVEDGDNATEPTAPKRSGYTFKGWYEDSELQYLWDFNEPIFEDITLYAKWSRNSDDDDDDNNSGSSSSGGGGSSGSITDKDTDKEADKDIDKVTDTEKGQEIQIGDNGNTVVVGGDSGRADNNPYDTIVIIGESGVPLGSLISNEHIRYIYGYPDTTVQSGGNITRAEAISMFYRLLQNTDKNVKQPQVFSDVAGDEWYSQAVNYMASIDAVKGYPDGSFKPDQSITRAEFSVLASNFDTLIYTSGVSFSDIAEDYWATSSINSNYVRGWIDGYGDYSFKPEQKITRGEAAKIINSIVNRNMDQTAEFTNPYIDIDTTNWAYSHIMEASIEHDFSKDGNGLETWNFDK